ncbi:hypothetical protein [Runella aurantiaca]|uniref:Uncharacterized protein n=1 Tax=Runella aurantiaca TaxID=2282308 RepID=A0A369IFM6_9BACT|nr:hypothetical protein [Runella aurantiaca]RDB07650.1 hypothetical protein DVG78_00895 [Runella aurantiaca]
MLSAVWLFYRQFWFFTNVVSWGGWLVAQVPLGDDLWLLFGPLFWLKLASFGVVWYFMHIFSRQKYLFYQNMGHSIPRLFVGAFCLDMLLFFGGLALINWLIHV